MLTLHAVYSVKSAGIAYFTGVGIENRRLDCSPGAHSYILFVPWPVVYLARVTGQHNYVS